MYCNVFSHGSLGHKTHMYECLTWDTLTPQNVTQGTHYGMWKFIGEFNAKEKFHLQPSKFHGT